MPRQILPIPKLSASDLHRFNKYFKEGPPAFCWLWLGPTKSDDNRGVLRLGGKTGHGYYAYRIAYLLYYGQINNDLLVLHTCDNPTCVNPHHLYQGTTKDNSQDWVRRQGGSRGSRNGHSKLKERQVKAIKKLLRAGKHTQVQISLMYGVSHDLIYRINRGDAWAWLKID